ncbi:DUF6440 family protein [Lapidilactobacillus bayanensis]|uniref:DUF6440 family protein n=1 Tax=Lapidilactobacillus bayanensis TaxID=2485998 RepID=UPI000F7AD1D4|nr:DUF6440 family protein [Lapidilactobacillus bayanensis]
MSKNENRFQVISDETTAFASGTKILKDTQTGVLYLFHYSGYAGGLTVLLDQNGQPVIDRD